MDDLTDASDNAPKPPLLTIELVEIVPFPNFENLQPVIPLPEDEVYFDDPLGFLNDPINGPTQLNQENINIGFAQILQPVS